MKKALILGTYIDPPYHPFQGVDRQLADILAADFEAVFTDRIFDLLTLEPAGFSLCVSYLDAFDTVVPAACAEALLGFVRSGGGLLCLHNGISLQTDDRLFRLIGGKFLRHPPQRPLTFTPVPQGFLADAEGFTFMEEPYQFEMSGDAVAPLLTYAFQGQAMPAGWCREEGAGRVAFLTPGHNADVFAVPAYRAMIAESARWAAGLA